MQSIQEFLNKITKGLNKIIQLIKEQIDLIIKSQVSQNQQFIQSKFIQINQIIKYNDSQNQSLKEFNYQLTEQLKILKSFIDNLIKDLEYDVEIQNIKEDDKKFQFQQFINSIQQHELCYAISVNSTNSILAAGSFNKIRIFDLKKREPKGIQQFNFHKKMVTQCYFIDNDSFGFVTYFGENLHIYRRNQVTKFELIKKLQIRIKNIYPHSFPFKFIKSKQLFIQKGCSQINIFKFLTDGNIILRQITEKQSNYEEGNISDDGQYFITWDWETKKFKIRKLLAFKQLN